MTEQEKRDHFSGDRNHWCIVTYISHTPFYYEGFFKNNEPVFTISFNDAMKCHSKFAVEHILNKFKSCTSVDTSKFKVEDHAWFGYDIEIEARLKGREGKEL